MYSHTIDVNETVHKKHSDFTGTFDDMRYIPVKWGGDADSPVLEISWDLTIDELTGIIDDLIGDVNRPDTDGTYISQVLQIGASAFDKVYWNETIPAAGGTVTIAIRRKNPPIQAEK